MKYDLLLGQQLLKGSVSFPELILTQPPQNYSKTYQQMSS